MAILVVCAGCKKKVSVKKKICSCGKDLQKSKKGGNAKYYIDFRLPSGKQRREYAGKSLVVAKQAEAAKRVKKNEDPTFFEKIKYEERNVQNVFDWYLNLPTTRAIKTYNRICICFRNLSTYLGGIAINKLKHSMLLEYRLRRSNSGGADASIDMEMVYAKTAFTLAYNDDKISGQPLKAFSSIKKLLKKGANARKRKVTIDEYMKLLEKSPEYLRNILIVAFHTGMRKGEIRNLEYSMIDKDKKFFRLPATITKEGKLKKIPLNYHVVNVLLSLEKSQEHDYVFLYKGRKLSSPGSLTKSLGTACGKANIKFGSKANGGLLFHDFRGTFKTNMLISGVDHYIRDRIVGHSIKGMDIHYISDDDEMLTTAIDKFTKWFDGKIERELCLKRNKS